MVQERGEGREAEEGTLRWEVVARLEVGQSVVEVQQQRLPPQDRVGGVETAQIPAVPSESGAHCD